MNDFLGQTIRNTEWKYVAISAVIVLILVIVLNTVLAKIIGEYYAYWFNNVRDKSIEIKDFNVHANNFMNSWKWVPFYMLTTSISQYIATRFLLLKVRDNQLTNSFSLAAVSVIFICQFSPIYSPFVIAVTFLTAYKHKSLPLNNEKAST